MMWAERQVRRADRFQQRHAVIGFPFAVLQKFGNDQASGKAALMAYYGLFALFPLLLLFTTILGYTLSGHPALRQQLINSALGYFPVIGDQLRSEAHPLAGNATALVSGIAGTIYGSLGIGLACQNAMNTVWNIPYVEWPSFWKRYVKTLGVIGLLSWIALGSQLTLWAAEINVVRRYRLWPRSITQPPLTTADRQVFRRLARMEVRRPEVEVATSFTEEADEDPLRLPPGPLPPAGRYLPRARPRG